MDTILNESLQSSDASDAEFAQLEQEFNALLETEIQADLKNEPEQQPEISVVSGAVAETASSHMLPYLTTPAKNPESKHIDSKLVQTPSSKLASPSVLL